MAEMQRFLIEPFKGLSTKKHATKIADNKSPSVTNMYVSAKDALTPLPGYVLDGTPFSTFTMTLVPFNLSNGTKYLILSDGTDWKYTTGNGTYSYLGYTTGTVTRSGTALTGTSTDWDGNIEAGDQFKYDADSTWLNIASVNSDTSITLSSGSGATSGAYMIRKVMAGGNIPVGVVLNDVAVLSDGDRIADSWNGTSLLDIANMTPVKHLVLHKRHVFGAINSTIYWSDINAPTTWTVTNTETIFNKDGGEIIALKSYASSLVVLKNNGKIYQFVGEAPFDATNATYSILAIDTPEGMGNIAPRTVVVHRGLLWFLASTGWYTFDGVTVAKVSEDIQTTTDSIHVPSSLGSSSSFSFVDDTDAEFDAGTHSSTDSISNVLQLKQDVTLDNFTDGNYTADPVWTVGTGSFGVSGGILKSPSSGGVDTNTARITTPSTNAYGTWQADLQMGYSGMGGVGIAYWHLMTSSTNPATTSGYAIEYNVTESTQNTRLVRFDSGAITGILTLGSWTYNTMDTWKVTRNSSGLWEVFLNGVSQGTVTDTTTTTSTYMMISRNANSQGILFWADNIKTSAISGTFVSQVFDGSMTLGAWGTLIGDITTNGETVGIAYRAEASNPPSGAFTTISNGQSIGSTNRYLQYRLTFTSSTKVGVTPNVSSVTVNYTKTVPGANTPYAWSDNNRLKSAYSTGGSTNNAGLILDEADEWISFNSSYPIFTTAYFNSQWYASDSTSGKLWILDSGLIANASAITRTYQTKVFNLGFPEYDKDFDRVVIVYKATSATAIVGYAVDTSSFTTTNVSLAGSGVGVQTVFIGQSGKTIQFQVQFTESGVDFEVHALILYATVKELR